MSPVLWPPVLDSFYARQIKSELWLTKRSLDVAQDQMCGAPSKDRTHYLVVLVIDLAREAC